MRRIYILLAVLVALTGCGKKTDETIVKGEIKGLTTDTIYLYGVGGLYDRTDTIVAVKGKFSCTLKLDTTSVVALLYDKDHIYPIFLEKGDQVKIKGNADGMLEANGNEMSKEFTRYQKELSELAEPTDSLLQAKAESYILEHPYSFVSIYLLDKYFVQKETPDIPRIKKLMEPLGGLLQDAPYVQDLRGQIEAIEKADAQKQIPFFSLPNSDGKRITRTDKFSNKYLVMHFWASWCEECEDDFATLRQINRTYLPEPKSAKPKKKDEPAMPEKKGFAMLGVSLDLDKESWEEAIKQDTLKWEQVINTQGFDAELVRQLGVLRIPAIFLMAPDGRIIQRNISADSLSNCLKELPLEKR